MIIHGLNLLHKRLLVVVAHQDDESLYFGGLLSSIAGRAHISLLSITAPMPGRADTQHRLSNFYRVGELLECHTTRCLNLPDCGPRGEAYLTNNLVTQVATCLAGLEEPYDIVVTHSALGEPNTVYGPSGHEAHKATHLGVVAVMRPPIITCGLGCTDVSFEIDYDRAKKKRLLDCYAPWWTPVEYDFVYHPERYALKGEGR